MAILLILFGARGRLECLPTVRKAIFRSLLKIHGTDVAILGCQLYRFGFTSFKIIRPAIGIDQFLFPFDAAQ